MARQRSYQTPRRTYNSVTNFNIGDTSHHGKSTIVVDNEGHEVHLRRTLHENHRHQSVQQPYVRDARSIIRAIRVRSNIKKKIKNTIVGSKRLEREGSDARKREIGRLCKEEIQKWMEELEYHEKELANERRQLQRNISEGTTSRDRSHHQRSSSRDRSSRIRRSKSGDRDHQRAIIRQLGGSTLYGNTLLKDYVNNDRRNNEANGDHDERHCYAVDDDDYHRRHNDYNRWNNEEDCMGYNNNQSDDEAMLPEKLKRLEREIRQTYTQLGRTKSNIEHVKLEDLQTRDYRCYANRKHLKYY